MPVAIQMSLQFRETTYITKEDFASQSLVRETSAPNNKTSSYSPKNTNIGGYAQS
jgi:hypothetical protein